MNVCGPNGLCSPPVGGRSLLRSVTKGLWHPSHLPYVYTVYRPYGLWSPSMLGGGSQVQVWHEVCDIQPTSHMCMVFVPYGLWSPSVRGSLLRSVTKGVVMSKSCLNDKMPPSHNRQVLRQWMEFAQLCCFSCHQGKHVRGKNYFQSFWQCFFLIARITCRRIDLSWRRFPWQSNKARNTIKVKWWNLKNPSTQENSHLFARAFVFVFELIMLSPFRLSTQVFNDFQLWRLIQIILRKSLNLERLDWFSYPVQFCEHKCFTVDLAFVMILFSGTSWWPGEPRFEQRKASE